LIRIRGELASGNNEGLAVCRGYFLRAVDLSTRQTSLSWELRAATSLVIAERSSERKEAASNSLQVVYTKFREGFDTLDLKLAAQVLNGSFSQGDVVRVVR
jgi:hypothetical protein